MKLALLAPARLLRALVFAGAALVVCWPLTTAGGVAAGAVGAALGVLAGEALAPTRLRTPALVGLCAGSALLGAWISRLMVSWTWVAATLGPLEALGLSEALYWLLVLGPTVTALRALSRRYPTMAVTEVVAVGAALALSVAAHRDGMVSRPIEVADWVLSRGGDPAVLFLALGGVGSLVLAALLLSEDRRRRLPLHFAGLGILALLLVVLVRLVGTPEPKGGGDLGLTGDPKEREEQVRKARARERGGQGSSGGQQDDLPFRDEYSSQGNQAPVAVVLLHDDYSPPSSVYYFRQSAFSEFNGIRLVQATRDDVDRDVVDHFPSEREPVADAPPVSRVRTELKTTVGLLADHTKPFALDSPASFWPIANPDSLRFRRAYVALSRVQTLPYDQMLGKRAGRADWTEEQWRHYTDYPRRDPRYGQLARQMVEAVKEEYRQDPLAQAVAVKLWLDKNGIYSRRNRHTESEDPTASFLFGDLTGYCVHFAHAAAFLLRSRGIPTRVAAGYAVEESTRGGGSSILVRGQNAHAWPEIYLDGVGWVVVDLTPERSLEPPESVADAGLQQMLGQMLRRQPKTPEEAEGRSSKWPTLAEIARVLLWIVAAVLASFYAVKAYRALAPALASPRQVYRVGFRAVLDRLADVGWRRTFGETRERFAERARAVAPSFAALTRAHLGAALGSASPPPAEELRRLARTVGGEIRTRVPAWRRLLGALNPVTSFLSR
jgi:transglutaminase-like putative cysteine protease